MTFWDATCFDNKNLKMSGWSLNVLGPIALGAAASVKSLGGLTGGGFITDLKKPDTGYTHNWGAGLAYGGGVGIGRGFEHSTVINVEGENEKTIGVDLTLGEAGVAMAGPVAYTLSKTTTVDCRKNN